MKYGRTRGALVTLSILVTSAAAATSISACVPKDRGAAEAYDRGDYFEAANTYDALLREKPSDPDLLRRRDEARQRAYGLLLSKIPRGPLDATIPALRPLLAQRETWTPGTLSLGSQLLDNGLATVANDVRAMIAEEIHNHLQARQPLGGKDALALRQEALPFPDFRDLWPILAEDVRTAAFTHCRAALPAAPAAQPFLTSLLTSYCSSFGAPVPAPPALDLANELTVQVSVAGVSEAQSRSTGGLLSMGFVESPWFDPASTRAITTTITGRNDFWFTARQELLSADWQEQVAYEDTETYQEPYDDTESYTEQVPYTVDDTEQYPCGTSTCTRPITRTEYRSETKFRTVTRYRTATRTITRYRTETRSHDYQALRRDGKYAANWQVSLELTAVPGEQALAFPVSQSITQYGYDHDETFEPAGLRPGRANLMTPDAWFAYVAAGLSEKLRDQLSARWLSSFCRLPQYSAETAARCARGAAPPPAARAALFAAFGNDLDRVLSRMTRWGAREQAAQDAQAATGAPRAD